MLHSQHIGTARGGSRQERRLGGSTTAATLSGLHDRLCLAQNSIHRHAEEAKGAAVTHRLAAALAKPQAPADRRTVRPNALMHLRTADSLLSKAGGGEGKALALLGRCPFCSRWGRIK